MEGVAMAWTRGEQAGVERLPALSWVPVIAGVLVALAGHILLGLVGAALGLGSGSTDSRGLAVVATLWGILAPFAATLVGAWLACRLAAIDEVRATNLHGVMVWCIGIIAGALFLTGSAAGGAMSASTAASGNAGFLSRATGAFTAEAATPEGATAEEVAAEAAKIAGAAALAALAGLLGAFAGAAIARARGGGLGWRIAIQRTDDQARRHDGGRAGEGRPEYPGRTYPAGERERPEEGPPPGYDH
jgi:hypothetical protein